MTLMMIDMETGMVDSSSSDNDGAVAVAGVEKKEKEIANPVVRVCENINCPRPGREFIVDGDNKRELVKKYCSDDCRDATNQRNRRARLKPTKTNSDGTSSLSDSVVTTIATDTLSNSDLQSRLANNADTDTDTYQNNDNVTDSSNADTDTATTANSNNASNDIEYATTTDNSDTLTHLAEQPVQAVTDLLLFQLVEEQCVTANANLAQIEAYVESFKSQVAVANTNVSNSNLVPNASISQSEAELLCVRVSEQISFIYSVVNNELFSHSLQGYKGANGLEELLTLITDTIVYYEQVTLQLDALQDL